MPSRAQAKHVDAEPVAELDKHDATREAIIDAAQACFQRWGVERTRMDDIGTAVGIARPNLYRYFSSKDAVLFAVIEREHRQIDERRRAVIPISGPVAGIILQSILMGMEMSRESEYLSSLTVIDSNWYQERLSLGSEREHSRAQYWHPILAHGRGRDEIRTDLNDLEIIRWLWFLQVHLWSVDGNYADIEQRQRAVRDLVIPSVLTPDALRVFLQTK